jgi:hypothetical protein
MSHHHRTPDDHNLQLAAYRKWEAAGMPAGDGVRFWLQAEQEAALAADATDVEFVQTTGHDSYMDHQLETQAAQENAKALNASVDSHYRDNNRMFQRHGDRGHRHGVKGE